MQKFDVIIIGGGFLGLSTAYQLSKMGVSTLLLEAGDIGGGTSASCSGRAQTCEGHLDPLNIQIIRDGLAKHETLEEELGATYDWRKIGLFLLIKSEELWNRWKERSAILTPAGIPTEVVDRNSLQAAEPHMNTANLLGAAYSIEGMLDPLKFSLAYAKAAQRNGAVIQGRSRVTGFEVQNQRITAVKTNDQTYYADKIAVMAGAWTSKVTELAGISVPVHHTHAEALVTERIPEMIFNNVELADFYETIHGKARAVAIGVHPQLNGTLDISEAVTMTDRLHKGVSAWGATSISKELIQLYPFLEKARIVRCWGRPTSFTPDEEPLIGWVPGLDNLFVATSLVITITTVPLLSEWMAMMLQGLTPPVSLAEYSPGRFQTA
ncbi:MAG: FAD-binding oxidoreductase [Anaerolineaceae bacterium]|nr:FAD-binding oxidoreductase [Anaerolineaceae bacterium]